MTDYKILIVDDEPGFLEKIIDIIEKAGEPYELFLAVSAEEAYNIATEAHPDLIVTDWEMPYMSGLELIEKLKANPVTKQIPIIMCTGLMTTGENLKIALEAGAVDYIRKPIDEIELVARIRSMLLLVESFNEIQKQKEQLLQRENELLKSSIAIKDKELTTNTLNKIHNQELLISIAEEMEHILQESTDVNIEKHIRELIKKMDIGTSSSNWEEFKNYFEKVHSEFFNRVLAHCSTLTQNEIKICALLKLNFSTKDISALTNQSTRSIEIARYRLRKKLNLNKEDNLVGFLSRF